MSEAIEECLERLFNGADLTDYGRDEILDVLRASPAPPTTEGREAIRREALEEAAKMIEAKHTNNVGMVHPIAQGDAAAIRSLSPPDGDGKQEQARPSGSAPISTLSKDTTK